jgi:DNA replication protein DnaC
LSENWKPSGSCKKCRSQLPDDRLFVCESCEAKASDWVQKQQTARIESNLRASKLPPAYITGQRGFADVTNLEALVLARGVLTHDVRGLYLWGTAGEEKTTLACATLAQLIRNDESGMYENSLDLMTDIHSAFVPGAMLSRHDVVTPPINAHALVLDDFGKEKASAFSAGVIYQILDGRYSQLCADSKRVLILVSNFPPAEACARFGDPTIVQPILRRISELTTAFEMNARK